MTDTRATPYTMRILPSLVRTTTPHTMQYHSTQMLNTNADLKDIGGRVHQDVQQGQVCRPIEQGGEAR